MLTLTPLIFYSLASVYASASIAVLPILQGAPWVPKEQVATLEIMMISPRSKVLIPGGSNRVK